MADPTTPEGFRLAAAAAGIKKSGLDLAVLYSERPAATAAVFTQNAFAAAPVLLSKSHLRETGNMTRAVLVNAGNANAVTGEEGLAAAKRCAAELAGRLGCRPSEIFIASTGVIGRPFPADRLCAALPGIVESLSADSVDEFGRAIMTTDTFPKIAALQTQGVRFLGFAKGAGMIHPNMATMLSFVATDAAIDFSSLDSALRLAVNKSFNCISVDGDTSTNDTLAVLANGASGKKLRGPEFVAALTTICTQLAKAIARDGEGATKFVELIIEGAPSDEAAREIGRTVARSPLVKTAIYGCDPNWGRLIAAIGNSGIPLSGKPVELFIDDIPLIHGDLARAAEKLRSKDITIRANLNSGSGKALVWTCDMTEGYIRINADYTS